MGHSLTHVYTLVYTHSYTRVCTVAQAFESKDTVADEVKARLQDAMNTYGWSSASCTRAHVGIADGMPSLHVGA